VPVIYVSDWPDLDIHTHKDVPGNLDATKIKRAMFIAAASAWYLANLEPGERARRLTDFIQVEMLQRAAGMGQWAESLSDAGQEDLVRNRGRHEVALNASLGRFGLAPAFPDLAGEAADPQSPAPIAGAAVYRRNPKLKGPMDGFGYSWLDDHLKRAGLEKPALLSREPVFDGPSYGYEALNLVDGKRTVQQIRDDLAATVGPAPVEEVAAYLAVLERLGVIRR